MRSFLQVEGVIVNKYVSNTYTMLSLKFLLTKIIGAISYFCGHVERMDNCCN